MNQGTEKYTILYARLSQEDKNRGVSDSIENQKVILEKFAEEHGFPNCLFKFDDGVSGTVFDRPAWSEVMELIESQRVGILVVKDGSRLGRNYWRVGELIEDIFPRNQVRYISITENDDSLHGIDDFLPFRSVMNDLQAKETSKKIKTVKQAKAQRGERIGSKAPYGYQAMPDDKRKMIPDPEAAEVVEKIFKLCAEGRGPKQISNLLEREKILNPSNYYYQKTGVTLLNLDTDHPYVWRHGVVSRIIENEVYLGHMISGREAVTSYKNKKKIKKPKEEWLKIENTHEPLVSQNLFDVANRVRQQKRRVPNGDEKPTIFSGMLFCADCGKPVTLQRYKTSQGRKNSFRCSTNRTQPKNCSGHAVGEDILLDVVMDDLKRVTHFARMNEEMFCQYISQKTGAESHEEMKKIERDMAKTKSRELELKKLMKKIYEDNISGRLNDETFDMLASEYNEEQRELKLTVPKLEKKLETLKTSVRGGEQFVEYAKEVTDLTELTSEVLRTFIEKIVVGEKERKYDKSCVQDIWIHYRGIGILDGSSVPEQSET